MSDGLNENKEKVAERYKSYSHSSLLLNQLAQLRNDSLLCDVTLVVQGARFNAHRNVLAACSDYFKAMFTNDMAEKHLREIEMFDVEASTLDDLLNFCYYGKITITEDNSLSTLAAACRFQLDKVQYTVSFAFCGIAKENVVSEETNYLATVEEQLFNFCQSAVAVS